ncbi:MAG: hypothetical protein JSW64_07790 [Candidatus Zixiibacteriota bacterium]|nr:MAG: hypothetical protein JSW64_07790 [candidate division Zixibacteria bacterium]
MKKLILSFILMLTSTSFAQQPDSTDCVGQLKKAAFLLGEWSGTGWLGLTGDQREYFEQTYLIQWKLDGAMMLIEGSRTFRGKKENKPDTTLSSLWTLAWYIKLNRFNITFFRQDGIYEIAAAEFPESNEMTWESKHPQLGTIRYAIAIDPEGNLVQTGEVLECDGGSWIKILEVVLMKEG